MKIYRWTLKERQLKAFERLNYPVFLDRHDIEYYNIIESNLPFELSRENKKYIPTAMQKFLIWNLPAIKTCPFASKDCIDFCYARKAEIAYPDCLPCRERHYQESLTELFADKMIVAITYYINTPSYKKAKNIDYRIHESGDFYSRVYVAAWLDIMETFLDIEKLHFIAYTKSFLFFIGIDRPANFTLSGSIDNSTTPEQIALCKELGIQTYVAIPEKDILSGKTCIIATKKCGYDHKCLCNDCGKCRYCFMDHPGKTTIVAIH